MKQMDNISIRIEAEKKQKINDICKNGNKRLSSVIREYLEIILEKNTTEVNIKNNKSDFKYILDKIQEDNSNIIGILKTQLEEKDEQLKNKDKLIENMQVLLKEEQSKNVLLLENKNNTNKTSWFPFFKNKNV